MTMYNLLFGKNVDTPFVLALIGLKEWDIERFRDCHLSIEDSKISVYTRTGGGNREDYPNEVLTTSPYYLHDEDDDFDNTYATFYFKVPDEIKEHLNCLVNVEELGIPAKLIKWVNKTHNREPTEADEYHNVYNRQLKLVRELRADNEVTVWNGHTVVPLSDRGIKQMLEEMEKNEGEIIAYWSLSPYKPIIRLNSPEFPSLDKKKSDLEKDKKMVVITSPSGGWEVNEEWWERWQEKFADKYPKSITNIRAELRRKDK